MPILADRISAWINKVLPRSDKATTGAQTLRAIQAREASVQNLAAVFQADRDRRSRVETARDMYQNDPRAKGVVKTLARDTTKGGFIVTANDDEAAQEVATSMLERIDVETLLDDWIRMTLRDGDSFLEVSINGDMMIEGVTRKPTLQMHRNSNLLDRFDDPGQAFWYSSQYWMGGEPPKDAIWFAQWQIVHARWSHDSESRYGIPMFDAGIGTWKKLSRGELDIAIRRMTRSGVKYHHKFPEGTESDDIETYREKNQVALDNPFEAVTDFFGSVDINLLAGDANLGDIGDVQHHLDTWWIESPVPKTLLGYGEQLNRDVLKEQEEQYRRALQTICKWAINQILRPLVTLQWLLQGFYPPHMTYVIKSGAKETITADVLLKIAQVWLQLRTLNAPNELIMQVIGPFLPGIDLSLMIGPHLPGGSGEATPDRIADAAEELRQRLLTS